MAGYQVVHLIVALRVLRTEITYLQHVTHKVMAGMETSSALMLNVQLLNLVQLAAIHSA